MEISSSNTSSCGFGSLIRENLPWICSPNLFQISDLKSKGQKAQLGYLRQAFSDYEPQHLEISHANVCETCFSFFGKRPGSSCKHPNHPDKNLGRLFGSKKIHHVTAKQYFDHYRAIGVKPNEGICKRYCFINYPHATNQQEESETEVSGEEFTEPPCKKGIQTINNVIEQIPGIEPVVLGKRNLKGQAILVSNKLSEIRTTLHNQVCQEGLPLPNEIDDKRIKQLEADSNDLKNLMIELKTRLQNCSNFEMISLLTLVPESWTHERAAAYFGVSINLIRSSRKRKNEAGSVLPPIKTKTGKKLDLATKVKVQDFYYEEDISRICPGAKDCVSVKDSITGKREKKQKRYLLANLKELYQVFKEKNPSLKIGISSFVSLRPTECFSLSTKGYHNVCLCVYHENLNLLFQSIGINSAKIYIAGMVCDVKNKNCMFGRCELCKLNFETVRTEINEILDKLQCNGIIRYKRWLSTDGTRFVCEEKPLQEFGDFLVSELAAVLKHHYISIAQHNYLKTRRESLKDGEIIVCGDFSENYTPNLQNSIQSEYFSQHLKQITLHPFNIYMKYDNKMYSFAFCIISDCNTHDTNSFYVFQSKLINELQKQIKDIQNVLGMPLPDIKMIYYFSDGCAGQYKNRKNFCNLYYHEQDFGIKAEWNFFATAHGKGPCDGHGGTTKWKAKVESERGETIQTASQLFHFAKKKISNIEYLLVTEEEINSTVEKMALVERYEKLSTVLGTQQGHRVIAVDDKIVLFETSNDTIQLTSKVVVGNQRISTIVIDDSSVNDWICCVYEEKWYVAVIDEVSMEEEEVLVSFYKGNSKKKTETFNPEGKNSSCWIPFGRIVKKIAPPKASRGGRTITVSFKLQEEFDELLEIFLQ